MRGLLKTPKYLLGNYFKRKTTLSKSDCYSLRCYRPWHQDVFLFQ